MLRSLMVAAAVAAGGMMFGVAGASAAPVTPAPQSVAQQSIVEKVQGRYCRRWYRECRQRWGGGWDFRRCMRRHGC